MGKDRVGNWMENDRKAIGKDEWDRLGIEGRFEW
jgi:hypothetical protein